MLCVWSEKEGYVHVYVSKITVKVDEILLYIYTCSTCIPTCYCMHGTCTVCMYFIQWNLSLSNDTFELK